MHLLVLLMQDFAEKEGMLFMETSALSGANVSVAFETLVSEATEYLSRTQLLERSPSETARAVLTQGRKIAVQNAAPQTPPARSTCCQSE
jgi:hypothetical protein